MEILREQEEAKKRKQKVKPSARKQEAEVAQQGAGAVESAQDVVHLLHTVFRDAKVQLPLLLSLLPGFTRPRALAAAMCDILSPVRSVHLH